MVALIRSDYNAAYFGDVVESVGLRHDAGYSNYLELQTNYVQRRNIVAFLKRHNIPKNAKILELGAGVGFMGLVATEEGYTDWTCVDWSNWTKRHEVFPVIEEDAFIYVTAQPPASFDYIITRAFLECFDQGDLDGIIGRFAMVANKQIHSTFLSAKAQFYNIKTIANWEKEFNNDIDVIIEDYRLDG